MFPEDRKHTAVPKKGTLLARIIQNNTANCIRDKCLYNGAL